ncbi:hypothetical protein STEG23_019294, partial [Scotinomys teguina]
MQLFGTLSSGPSNDRLDSGSQRLEADSYVDIIVIITTEKSLREVKPSAQGHIDGKGKRWESGPFGSKTLYRHAKPTLP